MTVTEKLQLQQRRFLCENCQREVLLEANYCDKRNVRLGCTECAPEAADSSR